MEKGRAPKRGEPKVGNDPSLVSSSKRDIPVPAEDGFTSAVFGWFRLPVRHGTSLPVCPAGVGTFPAQ